MFDLASRGISRRSLLKAGAATGLISGVSAVPFASMAFASGLAHLRLIETTDLHVHVYHYDYYQDRPDDRVGLGKAATVIRAARAEAANSLLLDNGDFLQGNPLGDYIAYERGMKDGDQHPIITAMNTLGYDAATLGNHEFNYGLDFLNKALAGAKFPAVLANLANGSLLASAPRGDKTFLKPYVILNRELVDGAGASLPIKIGVIGLVPPQIMNWDAGHLNGNVQARDMIDAAAAWVPEMKEAGADIIVALSHSGIAGGQRMGGEENASLYVGGIPGIDAVLTGHHHQVFPGPFYANIDGADVTKGTLMGKPAVMAGFWGSHVGIIDLVLQNDAGQWKVLEHKSETRPIYTRDGNKTVPLVDAQGDVLDSVKAEHEQTLAYVRRPVGQISAPVNSYFSLVYDDPSVQIVSQAQTWYVAALAAQKPEWKDIPVLSAAAPFKAGGRGGPEYYTDVPAGAIAIKNVADLYLYPNTVQAVLIDGATVKEWLERSAGMFNQLQPGVAEQELVNPAFPSYNFDVIDGVTYEIDLSQPSRYDNDGKLVAADSHRIVNLRFQGQAIDPAVQFIVATNNYRAGGGGKFPGIDASVTIIVAPDTNRDVIVRYLVEKGTINPAADSNWTFKPVSGVTKAMFDSSPKAKDYAASLGNVSYVGDGANGFARYALNIAG